MLAESLRPLLLRPTLSCLVLGDVLVDLVEDGFQRVAVNLLDLLDSCPIEDDAIALDAGDSGRCMVEKLGGLSQVWTKYRAQSAEGRRESWNGTL